MTHPHEVAPADALTASGEWARRYLMFQLGDLKKVLNRIATHNEIDLDHITQQMTPEQVAICDRAATDLRTHILAILDTPESAALKETDHVLEREVDVTRMPADQFKNLMSALDRPAKTIPKIVQLTNRDHNDRREP